MHYNSFISNNSNKVFSAGYLFMAALLALLLTPFALYVESSVFVYSNLSGTLVPQPPPLIINSTGAEGVAYDFSPTYTSATAYISTSNNIQLLYNPDFLENPDGWYCTVLSPNLDCYWLPYDRGRGGGSSGGVALIEGTIPVYNFILSYAEEYILQEIYIPSGVTIVSAQAEVRVRAEIDSFLGFYYYEMVVGLYNLDTNTGIAYNYWYSPGRTYGIYTIDFTAYVTPGSRYLFFVGINVTTLETISVAFYVDWAYFNLTLAERAFSNNILLINSTQSVYGFLELITTNASTGFSASIYIDNGTTLSTPILIENGVLLSDQTSTVLLPIGGTLYNSGHIKLNITKTTIDTVYMRLNLVYCTGVPTNGACVYYPITLYIDPVLTPLSTTLPLIQPQIHPSYQASNYNSNIETNINQLYYENTSKYFNQDYNKTDTISYIKIIEDKFFGKFIPIQYKWDDKYED